MTSEIQEAARNYINAGMSVIPVTAKKKSIGPWRQFQNEILPVEDVTKKFNGSKNIAIICGEVSQGLECLDIDDVEVREDLVGMIKIKHKNILDRLVFSKTPRGYGVVYRCEENIEGNQKLAMSYDAVDGPGAYDWNGRADLEAFEVDGKWFVSACKLETRGSGGYFLSAPSPGYEVLEGDMLNLQPISAEDRDSILNIARGFDSSPKEPTVGVTKKPRDERLKILYPSDVYNAAVDYPELLIDNGWQKIGNVKGGSTWRRPNGTAKKISATLYDDGMLMVFSTNALPLKAEKQYSAANFYCEMNCGGDFKAATKEWANAGYTPEMTEEEVREVLEDNPDELDNAYRRSGLGEAAISAIAIDLGLTVPVGKGAGRIEIFYDKTELNRVVDEMDHAVATVDGKWGYYKFMTVLGMVDNDNSFRSYKKTNFEQRCEQSFYMTSYVKRGKKSELERIKAPPHCIEMLMDYPDMSAKEIRGFAAHPVLMNDKIIGLQDGFEDGIMFKGCNGFKIDDRSFLDCYNRVVELFCGDMLFVDADLGPALFVSMMMTAVARLGLDGGCPGYLVTANSPGTGKSTLFEIVSRVVYGKLFPSVRWKESVEEMGKELVSYLRRGKECMLYDNIQQKKAIGNEDLAQLITAGCFEGRILGLSEEITVDARAMFVFIGNDIKLSSELTRRVMSVELRAERDNPERRPVKIKRISQYCDDNRNEAMGCILKMLQEGVKMEDKLDHSSGLEFWDKVVRNPIVSEVGIDISRGFDISATNSEENQSVKSIVHLLAAVFGVGVHQAFYTRDVYLAITDNIRDDEIKRAGEIRKDNEEACRELRDALLDINQRAAMTTQSTGNAMKTLSDYQISGDLRFVRHITKSNQSKRHWIEAIE